MSRLDDFSRGLFHGTASTLKEGDIIAPTSPPIRLDNTLPLPKAEDMELVGKPVAWATPNLNYAVGRAHNMALRNRLRSRDEGTPKEDITPRVYNVEPIGHPSSWFESANHQRRASLLGSNSSPHVISPKGMRVIGETEIKNDMDYYMEDAANKGLMWKPRAGGVPVRYPEEMGEQGPFHTDMLHGRIRYHESVVHPRLGVIAKKTFIMFNGKPVTTNDYLHPAIEQADKHSPERRASETLHQQLLAQAISHGFNG